MLFLCFRTAAVDEQACREAMLQFVSENCCYGKGPAKEHQVDNIKPSNALHVSRGKYIYNRSLRTSDNKISFNSTDASLMYFLMS